MDSFSKRRELLKLFHLETMTEGGQASGEVGSLGTKGELLERVHLASQEAY